MTFAMTATTMPTRMPDRSHVAAWVTPSSSLETRTGARAGPGPPCREYAREPLLADVRANDAVSRLLKVPLVAREIRDACGVGDEHRVLSPSDAACRHDGRVTGHRDQEVSVGLVVERVRGACRVSAADDVGDGVRVATTACRCLRTGVGRTAAPTVRRSVVGPRATVTVCDSDRGVRCDRDAAGAATALVGKGDLDLVTLVQRVLEATRQREDRGGRGQRRRCRGATSDLHEH